MRILAILAAAAVLQGCAFTDAKLKVAHSPKATYKGPLGGVDPTTFHILPLADERQDRARVGYKKNGFGSNSADITTVDPVIQIVANGVAAGLQRNGHTVASEADISISGAVTRFWFEFDPNFLTVTFTGNVECKLEFVDTKSGARIYGSTYNGTYKRETGGGLEATWTEVLNAAVDKVVEDVVFDADLVEALETYAAAPATVPLAAPTAPEATPAAAGVGQPEG